MRIVTGSILLSFFWGIFLSPGLWAQSSEQQDELLPRQQLQRAIQLIDYNKNDSAVIYLEPVWEQLVSQELTDSPFGLEVQLARARVLEQKHNHSEAILLFNELKTKSKASQQWETYAGTCLSLAQLYEKMYRMRRSKEHLDLAHVAISQHQLDSLYPSLLIRRAIWNMNFKQHPDSVEYYSQKALSIVNDTVIDSPTLSYSLYLIQGIMVHQKDYREAVEWYEKALAIAKVLKDPVRMSAMWNRISKTCKDLKKALAYSDSTIQACYQAIAAGHERFYTLHNAYQRRSSIYYADGQFDSAYHYLKKGLSQEVTYIQQQQFDRVSEVDARYRDEQKTKQLEDQAKTILYEQRIRKLLLAIFVVTLVLAVGLAYGLISRRKSMRKLSGQNRLIQQQSEQLKSLDAAKSRFFANVSHELRTPLTLVLGPIQTALKSGTLNNRNFTLLTMAQQNANNLLQLVGSILDLSKLEHGKLRLEEKPERLFPLLRRLVSIFESHAQREGIELIFDYQAEESLRLQLDQLKLKNILNNLLSNAIKFTQSGGKIKVTTIDKRRAILLSVQDTGRGITANDLPHVFDRFYQSEEKNAPTEGGTGIGLAFCKELTTIMGGKIWVESQSGVGSTFYVELPRKEVLGVQEDIEEESLEEQPAAIPVLPENEKASKENGQAPANSLLPTILVVEDNYSLRDYLTTILEPHYKVVPARNGEDALNLLNGKSNAKSQTVWKPSLIISDVMMPVMDGYQLLENAKTRPELRHIPVIMLTARAGMDDKLKALRIGVDDYLNKPFNEEELLVRIENLIQNSKNRTNEVPDTTETEKEETALSEKDLIWLKMAEQEVLAGISSYEFSIETLATALTTNRWQLSERLKSITGLTTNQYIQEIRLNHARNMLETGQVESIKKLTYDIGMKDSQYFARLFKKRFGRNPSDFL